MSRFTYGTTTTFGNRDSYNSKFLSPITPTGQVLINGKMDQSQVSFGSNNSRPKWALPTGSFFDSLGVVETGDIVWKPVCSNVFMNTTERDENIHARAISCLNGQGLTEETTEEFMQRIDILGLAFMSNDKNNTQYFNIHVGGIYTIRNNGNEDINIGDYVMAYAPRPDEVNKGGKGESSDANGVVKLWVKPYRPEHHKLTAGNIYRVLTRSNTEDRKFRNRTPNGLPYLPELVDQCHNMFDSWVSIGMTILLACDASEDIPVSITGDRASVIKNILEKLGHKRFENEGLIDRDFKQQVIDSIFVQELQGTHQKSRLFFGNDKTMNSVEDRLMRCQLEGPQNQLYETARFISHVTKKILGKAISCGTPKGDFNIQLCAYSMKK